MDGLTVEKRLLAIIIGCLFVLFLATLGLLARIIFTTVGRESCKAILRHFIPSELFEEMNYFLKLLYCR